MQFVLSASGVMVRIKSIILGTMIYSFVTICHASNQAPEISSAQAIKPLVHGKQGMIVTNNPYASRAANEIIQAGGNAFDAAIAAGFVLGLTEPQSSGIGGGGYALTYNSKNNRMLAYDGREVAPHTAHPGWFLDDDGTPLTFKAAQWSAKSVGVPGEVMLFYRLHQMQGKLPWPRLLKPAIQLASSGFKMTPRLDVSLKPDENIFSENPEIRRVYFSDGHLKKSGDLIINKAYAETLQKIANNPMAFYRGKLAQSIVKAINHEADADIYRDSDFANYHVLIHQPICTGYRTKYQLCTVPPSASGGVTAQMLMNLYAERYHGTHYQDPRWMYYFIEASKLAFADRDQYLADPDYIHQPVDGLLDHAYLKTRSAMIADTAFPTPVTPGKPRGASRHYAADASPKRPGTTSLAIVDSAGNAISLTVTIESRFGSHLFTHGFFLNNELTDFSFKPKDDKGRWVANRVQAGKRPRSSIAPMFVFNQRGKLLAISGSPGGNEIICYVAKSLILMLDMKLPPDQASRVPNLCSLNDDPELENGTPESTISYLSEKAEKLQFKELTSGIVNISRDPAGGWLGAADPRREGVAIGLPSN